MIVPCIVTSARYCSGVMIPPLTNGKCAAGHTKMEAHQKRKYDPNGDCRERQKEILEANDLVIRAENPAHWPAAPARRKLS